MGQIRPMARVGLVLACYPNGPNLDHGKSRPVSSEPILYSGPLSTRYACDRIKPLLSSGLLTARYSPIPVMPIYAPCGSIYPTARGPPILRPVGGPVIRRPVGGPWILRPIAGSRLPWSVYGQWLLRPLANQGKIKLGNK